MESKGRTPIKKNVFFRALPEMGGGETPAQIFYFFSTMLSLIFWHQYHVMWYFLVIFNTKIIKSTKIIITIITHIIVVIIVTWFCNTRKTSFLTSKKVVQLARIGGRGGERLFGQCPKEIDFFYGRCSLMASLSKMKMFSLPHLPEHSPCRALPSSEHFLMRNFDLNSLTYSNVWCL